MSLGIEAEHMDSSYESPLMEMKDLLHNLFYLDAGAPPTWPSSQPFFSFGTLCSFDDHSRADSLKDQHSLALRSPMNFSSTLHAQTVSSQFNGNFLDSKSTVSKRKPCYDL